MKENLVIVESPAKAKTIEKFLGGDFVVRSSYGHIRDLVTKGLGVDVEKGFEPQYEVEGGKKKLVSELSALAKKSKTVWLASDEDREGEAIAWHLSQVLGIDEEKRKRIVFHEITKNAILEAVQNPRDIDMNRVDAQQARRVLDRLVGFELSPVLWRKVRPQLSAGRVQSVTVRLLVEREREILAFQSKKYYRVVGEFAKPGGKSLFRADLNKRFDTEEQARTFLEECRGAIHKVTAAESKPATKSPAPPFTTSTLQQEAGRKLGMSVSRTMSVAQSLYENGFITYMRTDSVNLSKQAIAAIKAEVEKEFGGEYSQVRNFKTSSKGAQEAHEAIRPSYADRKTIEGSPDEKRLYELIWKRAVASQMAPAQIERTVVNIDISTRKESFTATGEVIKFDGFLRLYSESTDETAETDDNVMLPDLKVGETVSRDNIAATESFTQAPPRYSEASLVKRLEELGIGRPSTYAPTITTVINRGYVIKDSREGVRRDYVRLELDRQDNIAAKKLSQKVGAEKNKLFPTDIGIMVTDYLTEQFKPIMDYNFTASVEEEFDQIAEGKLKWRKMLENFYGDFHRTVEAAMETIPQNRNYRRELGTDPVSGKEVIARIGRFGPMVQIGNGEEGEKARFASMRKDQLIESITLEEALALFALPRTLGQSDAGDVVVNIGRFGPYVLYNSKFTSLAKTDDPYTITLERALELIKEKAESDAAMKTPLKTFEEEPGLQILNGRYGPYISFDGRNYRIPKGSKPEELTLEDCRGIIAKSPEPGAAKRPKRAASKKK